MMDARSPATPSIPYGQNQSQYKVNVSRQKTRKWVEAKTQNYDGDDWGAEDEFDEYDNNDNESGPQLQPQPQRPGRLTAGLRAISASGASTPASESSHSSPRLRPSERIALEKQQAAGQRSVTGPPALYIQTPPRTQTSPIPQIAGPTGPTGPSGQHIAPSSTFPLRKSSIASQERPDFADQAVRPPRTSSMPESPAGGVKSPVSATASPVIVRPSDIYKRMEQEKEKERRSSLDSVGRNDGENEPATNPPRRPSFGMTDIGDGSRGLRPLEPVAERKSEYGFDGITVNPDGPPPEASKNTESEPTNLSQPQPPTLQHPQARKELRPAIEPTKRYSTSPTLPALSRMSGFGGDFFSGGLGFMNDSEKQSNPPAENTPEQPQTSSIMVDSTTEPATRDSPTPSTTSADPTPSHSSREPDGQPGTSESGQATDPLALESNQANPIRPSLPGGWVTETVTPAEMATPGNEQAKYGSDLAVNAGEVPTINEQHPENLYMRPAPLRTPSPRDTSARNAGDDSQNNRSGRASPANLPPLRTTPSPRPAGEHPTSQETSEGAIPPKDSRDEYEPQPTPDMDALGIAPLQPRKGSAPDSSPEDLRPPIMRVETYGTTDNSSPLKESDFLRDEIMRSLSPVCPADGLKDTPRDEGADRDSSYLSDVYGDYWSGDDKKPEATATTAEQGVKDTGKPEPTSIIKEESVITPTPPVPTWTSEAPVTSAEPAPAPAVEPEAAKPGLNRDRFSWEAGSETNKSAEPSPSKESLPQSLDELTSAISPTGQPELSLPTLSFDDNNANAGVVSELSGEPSSQRFSMLESPSPVSNGGDRDGPTNAPGDRSNLFSYAENKMSYTEDKVLIQSPMSPMSPLEPIGIQDNEEPPPAPRTPVEDAPEVVPLPRSPSPTKPRSQPAYNSMTLKQILQLPTSADRVLKMQETREHFAELDSGLCTWLAEMSSHEQHENAMPTYNYALSGADAELWGTKGGARIPLNTPAEEAGGQGGGANGGQSYSGGGATLAHTGRSASGSVNLGNLVIHSGQAGAKGKELLHSAGKLSKGLLSKGKNKLRERAESKKG
ncbi:hypothetical protein VP1G_04391 [Cytospora mali]|uniref:Uncharacterized protein n=1 Tax=Cytospora mali TaxID=578113 RepID=A0A194UZJ3_CYTMA|nr:hypothetical protein VP1G_04391 [Valsa mali var. pyri (nom. inval.)]